MSGFIDRLVVASKQALGGMSLYSAVQTLDQAHLEQFPRDLLGSSMSPKDARDASRHAITWDESLFRKRLPNAARHLVAEPLAAHRQLLEKASASARDKALRTVYVMPAVPLGEGHAVAQVSFAHVAPPRQEQLMGQHNLMRYIVSAFVGGGASYTQSQRQAALGTAKRYRPRNIPRPLPHDVVARNAELYTQDAPVQGMLLLGKNSWCVAKAHLVGVDDNLPWQSVVMETTDIHSQDGTVIWIVLRHPGYPEGLIYTSVHYGNHQVPLGDTINAWLAPMLLHPTFHRAMHLAEVVPALEHTFGKAHTAELLLNEAVARRFQELEKRRDARRDFQFKLLQMMDETAGFLVTSARYLRTTHG